MTRVELLVSGDRRRLTAKGHATGDAESCNYITGVLYSLAGLAVNEAADGRTRLLQARMEPGDVAIETQGGERMEAGFDMALIGLLQLGQERPEAVRVDVREERDKPAGT